MSSAATPLKRPATEADLLALPEEGRGYELVDGELVEKHTGARHGQAQVRLVGSVRPYDRRAGGGGGPGGWRFLTEQLVRFPPHTLRPDVAGWRRERLPDIPRLAEDGVLDLRPDWVCEILSAGHAADDLVRKMNIYLRYQVPHYWIIDPRDEVLTVYRFAKEGYLLVQVAQRGDRVRAEPFHDVELHVGSLFGEDDEA